MTAMARSGGDSTSSTPPTPQPFGTPGQYDERGVDLSLIRVEPLLQLEAIKRLREQEGLR